MDPPLTFSSPEGHSYVHLLGVLAERVPGGVDLHKHDVVVGQRGLGIKHDTLNSATAMVNGTEHRAVRRNVIMKDYKTHALTTLLYLRNVIHAHAVTLSQMALYLNSNTTMTLHYHITLFHCISF